MKLLKIDKDCGYYRGADGKYVAIDKLRKEDLLRLVDWVLQEDQVEMDEFDENLIKHQAHQVIYKSVAHKLRDLKARKPAFIDESARLFLDEYERYRHEPAK